jgi:hypothetical protein
MAHSTMKKGLDSVYPTLFSFSFFLVIPMSFCYCKNFGVTCYVY